MTRYAKPKTVGEALDLLGQQRWRIVSGGTDFYPAQGARPLNDDVLDINSLTELRGITETPEHVVFGARATWTQIAQTALPPAFDALRAAGREVGSVQIQNVATIAGNLCNASPAADGVPPLLVLDADVELRSANGTRYVPLSGFILGNRRTALQPDELLTAIRAPKPSSEGSSAFVKLGARKYLVISIAMAAARLALDDDGRIAKAALAVGSCSAVAHRLTGLEAALAGCRPGAQLDKALQAADLAELSPIDDVRGTAGYRREAAREIVARAIASALRASRPQPRAA